jgi:large subunit ribosomal protein LP2
MKLIAAYALLVLGGKEAPSSEEVTALVTSAGGEVDEASLAALMGDVEGKDIHELLAKGAEDLKACVSSGGGGGAAAPAAGGAAPAAAAAPEKPKEEEVDALDGGMDMFGGPAGGGDY